MPPPSSPPPARWCVLGRTASGELAAVRISAEGTAAEAVAVPAGELGSFVAALESAEAPRWVWHSTASVYPTLLAEGVRVERCHDLVLCHQILGTSAFVAAADELRAAEQWSVAAQLPGTALSAAGQSPQLPTLFDLEAAPRPADAPSSLDEVLREFARQRAAVDASHEPGRLSLLLAAESAGALVAVELATAGVPWDTAEHDRILTEVLGPRPAAIDGKPEKLTEAADRVRDALGDPGVSLDSHPKLLRALRSAGIEVSSTSQWELSEHTHPAIEPLLTYKKLARLLSANGWVWLDEWVHDGRYRPVYVPGGVVTGRWASSGGGALQLPRMLRPALRADPGWKLVSADVSQLEPRVLAAMSGDRAMAAAGRGRDLYSGIVETGSLETRADAKIAMLGAMYGATSGDSGRLVPKLRRAFPAAMRFVDAAADVGERGGTVSTWLGRSSPPPEPEWRAVQAAASLPGATRRDEELAKRTARDRGRFTRNFVVQGTAAEWALAWLAAIRRELAAFPEITQAEEARGSGPVFARRPHLAFFLHDEIIVHTPAEHADAVARIVSEAADSAGKLLFGSSEVDFRLDLRVTERAEKG